MADFRKLAISALLGCSIESQASSIENVSLEHKIIDRSTIFCSSRIFPGQEYAWQSSNVRFSICLMRFAMFSANFLTKYSIRSGMSSVRFRRGGTWMGKTFNL